MTFWQMLDKRWADVVFLALLSAMAVGSLFGPPGCGSCLSVKYRSEPSPATSVSK